MINFHQLIHGTRQKHYRVAIIKLIKINYDSKIQSKLLPVGNVNDDRFDRFNYFDILEQHFSANRFRLVLQLWKVWKVNTWTVRRKIYATR